MKQKITALIMTLLMLISAIPVVSAVDMTFSDVPPEHKAFEAIEALTADGIINGKSDTEFDPEGTLKREEFAKILSLAFKLDSTSGAPIFQDVLYGSWYDQYAAKVAATGLMTGVSQELFGVGQNLSRQDLALILKRFIDGNEIVLSQENTIIYADNKDVSEYAVDAVTALASSGIMEANSDNCFHPREAATRADAAQVIHNVLVLKKYQEENIPLDEFEGAEWLVNTIPEPFNLENTKKVELHYEDFEDTSYGILQEGWFMEGSGVDASGEGYESNGSFKIDKLGANNEMPYFLWVADDLNPGDYLTVSAMIKGENIGGHSSIGIQIWNGDTGEYIKEYYYGTASADNNWKGDWLEIMATAAIPVVPNKPRPSSYRIHFMLVPGTKNANAVIHFDDMHLYRTIFDPMETCLMSPNYKGLIYGDGGKGDIRLQTYVFEQSGGYDVDDMIINSKIVDHDSKVYMETECKTVTERMQLHFSSDTLPMGDFHLVTTLRDKNTGEELDRQDWTIRKREKDFRPEGYYDEYNRYIWRGEPELTMMIYSYGGGLANHLSAMDCIQDCAGHEVNIHAEMGLGLWHIYFREGNEAWDNWKPVFEEAQANNIRMFGSLGHMHRNPDLYAVGVGPSSDTDLINTVHFLAKDNAARFDALGGYYLFDEMNMVIYGDDFAFLNDQMAYHDLDHFTNNALDDLHTERPGVNARCADVNFVDEYPIRGLDTDNVANVYSRVCQLRETVPGRPVGLIAQGFKWANNGGLREPTQQEFRCMLFQSLCAGVSAIKTYAYQHLRRDSPDTWRDSWEGYMEVYDEIGRTLEPIYMSILPAPYYEVRGGGTWLNHFSRRYDGKSYIFAVNNQKAAKTAKIYIEGAKTMTGMYSKKTYEADSEGWVTVDFEGLATDVFVYDQPDYQSSHAELQYFGLMDAEGSAYVLNNSDSEKPCFYVGAEATEVHYSAKPSDYATVYINGEKVENTGVFSLNGLSEFTVKIVSEDGRFSTEKTYSLNREN